MKRLLKMLLLIFPLASPVWAGTSTTITLCERSYILYAPSSMPSNAPLLIALHAGTSSASAFQAQLNNVNTTAIESIADSKKFYIAYAVGTEAVPNAGSKVWTAGRNCCGIAYGLRIRDREFIHNIIKHVSETHSVDPSKVFLTGYSNGSFLVYDYLCHYTDIAGATVFAARLLTDHRDCGAVTIPITHIYGLLDTNVPPAGGVGPADGVLYPPLADTVNFLTAKGATMIVRPVNTADHQFPNIKSGYLAQYGITVGDVIGAMVSP
jgi:polyhydroxybutyrate depolymerase